MTDANKMLTYESHKKSGWLAGLLNLVIPGLGYGYCGRWVLGLFAFVFVIAASLATFGVAWPFLAVLIFVDGFLAAGRHNKDLARQLTGPGR